jgi:hypothetical protein
MVEGKERGCVCIVLKTKTGRVGPPPSLMPVFSMKVFTNMHLSGSECHLGAGMELVKMHKYML